MGIFNLLLAETNNKGYDAVISILTTFQGQIKTIKYTVLAVMGALCGVFAIYLGFKLATATDDAKRMEAKAHVVYAIIGVIIIGALAGATYATDMFTDRVGADGKTIIDAFKGAGNVEMEILARLVNVLINMAESACTLLGIWLGFRVAYADNEQKRRDAKIQLFWAFLGVIVAIGLDTALTGILKAQSSQPATTPPATTPTFLPIK